MSLSRFVTVTQTIALSLGEHQFRKYTPTDWNSGTIQVRKTLN
ncbi:hypothetical protein [Nostoc sp.]